VVVKVDVLIGRLRRMEGGGWLWCFLFVFVLIIFRQRSGSRRRQRGCRWTIGDSSGNHFRATPGIRPGASLQGWFFLWFNNDRFALGDSFLTWRAGDHQGAAVDGRAA